MFELHKVPRRMKPGLEYGTAFVQPREICEDCMGWNGKEHIPKINGEE
jgi:hypothetical protein